MSLLKIASEYNTAELTFLALHQKNGDYFNLFTVIELVPNDQIRSKTIGSIERQFERLSADSEYTLFIGRTFTQTPADAIRLFMNSSAGFDLKINGRSQYINNFPGSILIAEPPGENALLVNSFEDLAAVLPRRNTQHRVWTKIDKQKEWLNKFSARQLKTLLRKAATLTLKYLNFDISVTQEHLGNVYLCGCNPFVRSFKLSLVDTEKKLLAEFKERESKHISGCRFVLEEKRGNNTGFSMMVDINSIRQIISLPYFPDQLITHLYGPDGEILHKHSSTWCNFSTNLNLIDTHVNLTIEKDSHSEIIKIPKHGKAEQMTVGNYDHSGAQYFETAAHSRHFLKLERSKDFIFFPGELGDKDKAERIIRDIISKVSYRCMLLDPYFGATDIVYAIIVENTSFPVQVLSSANFLGKKVGKEVGNVTNAERLMDALSRYKELFSRQVIECRVLKGNKRSPLHDRYIIADDRVYLLGSSFNEFGSRATTLAKVPTPNRIIAQAVNWWRDDSASFTLEDFINLTKQGT